MTKGSLKPRSRFGTNIGFVLSGIGSAVGLGSFWRFPQLTSQNGGGAFVVVFLGLLLLLGVPLLWSELALGQRAQGSPIRAMEQLGGPRWRWLGFLFVGVSFLFLGYYTVLTGIVLKYAVFSFSDAIFADPFGFLESSEQGGGAILAGLLGVLATGAIVAFGVSKGLERANLVMMPGLALMLVALVAYALGRPGAGEGLGFYLGIEWGEITARTFQQAIGQVFFAIGIGFGIMLTYASYLKPGKTLLAPAACISGSILIVGLLAGLMIFPLVFDQGLEARITDPNASPATTLLLTMPSAFAGIGGFLGKILMFVFFVMLFFAGLSSTISALEVLVSSLVDSAGATRFRANWIASEWYFVPGVFAAASTGIFAWFDAFLGGVLLVASVIGLCLLYTFVIKDRVGTLLGGAPHPTRFQHVAARATAIITAYVAPIILIVIFLLALPDTIRSLFG